MDAPQALSEGETRSPLAKWREPSWLVVGAGIVGNHLSG